MHRRAGGNRPLEGPAGAEQARRCDDPWSMRSGSATLGAYMLRFAAPTSSTLPNLHLPLSTYTCTLSAPTSPPSDPIFSLPLPPGRGASGSVWQGTWKGLSVAVKTIYLDVSGGHASPSPGPKMRCVRYGRASSRCDGHVTRCPGGRGGSVGSGWRGAEHV
jgi:hypothetical protein